MAVKNSKDKQTKELWFIARNWSAAIMREHPSKAQAAVRAYQLNQLQSHTAQAGDERPSFSKRRANPTFNSKVPWTQATSCVVTYISHMTLCPAKQSSVMSAILYFLSRCHLRKGHCGACKIP